MSIVTSLRLGIRNLFRRNRVAREMEDELRAYYEAAVDSRVRAGVPADHARREARIQTGSIDAAKERVGAIGWERAIEAIAQDIGFAGRMMRKSPLATTVTILTLAVGIGANSAMFGIVYGLLFKPLPFTREDRIAIVHMHFAPQNNPRGNMSLADFVDWRANNHSFQHVAAYSASRFVLTGGDRAEEVLGASVTADYFAVLGTPALLGRTFQPGDDTGSAPAQVVISSSLWQRRFHRDPSIIGRVLTINGATATIIGVVDDSHGFPRAQLELWRNQPVVVTRRGPFTFHGIARLRDGVTLAQAQAELNMIGRGIEAASPSGYSHLTIPTEPLHEFIVGRTRPALLLISAAVAMVLLIAIVNIATLMMVRSTARQPELAMRLSLGATRARLIQQLLTESIITSLLGGACGLALAYVVVRLFRSANPMNLPIAYQAQLDWRVLLCTFGISLFAGIAFGVAPAIHSARVNAQSGLREGSRSVTSGAGEKRTRSVLVCAEIALSMVLLLGAGLLLRSFVQLQRADIGVTAPASDVLSLTITPGLRPAPGDPQTAALAFARYYANIIANVQSIPGVQSVTAADALPPNSFSDDDTFRIAGRAWNEEEFPSTTIVTASPDYFTALGVPLVRGRFFAATDTETTEPVAVVSQSFARRYFPNTDPIGQKIAPSGPGNNAPWMSIVGVVGDVKFWGVDTEFKPTWYAPLAQNGIATGFVIVRAPHAAELAPAIERTLRQTDKDAVVRRIVTLEDVLDEAVEQPRLRTTILVAFAAVALLLAAIGIYGVIAYSVVQRTPEIGIRMALGADRTAVLGMVMRNGMLVIAAGIILGCLAALATTRLLTPFLYATRATDSVTFVAGCALLLLVSTVATLLPAVRATRIDPLIALRRE